MKNFIGISEPKIEAIKYDIKKFVSGSHLSFFIRANIILYFIFILEKILGKYL